MDVTRLGNGEKLAGVSAVLLFIFTFFDWFGVKISGPGGSASVPGVGGSAWDVLDIIPIIIVIAVIAAIAWVVMSASDSAVDLPVAMSAIVTALAGLATLLILYRIINPPGGGDFLGTSIDVTRKLGIFLGFLAAAGVTVGGYLGMQEEGTSFSDVGDRLGGGDGGAAPPPPPGGTGEPGAPPPPPPAETPPPPGGPPPPPGSPGA